MPLLLRADHSGAVMVWFGRAHARPWVSEADEVRGAEGGGTPSFVRYMSKIFGERRGRDGPALNPYARRVQPYAPEWTAIMEG